MVKGRKRQTELVTHTMQDDAELQRLRERLALTPTKRWERFMASMRSLQGFRAAAEQQRTAHNA